MQHAYQWLRSLFLFGALFAVVSFSVVTTASAATIDQTHSAPVQLAVADTTLTVTGLASPGSLVTIFDGGVVAGTVVADASGNFTKTFTAVVPGLHTIGIQFIDSFGLVSDQISDIINVANKTNTNANYILPPTLAIFPADPEQGEAITLRGSTIPGATVEIIIDGVPITLQPQTGADGLYEITVPTTGYSLGQHVITAQMKQGATTSTVSSGRLFTVGPVTTVPGNNAPADETEDEGEAPDTPSITSPLSPVTVTTDSLRIDGQAGPNQQIVIYLDGVPIGSTFSNAEGDWAFIVNLSGADHVITTEACDGSLCSKQSDAIVVEFPSSPQRCSPLAFRLDEYRFYGSHPGEGIDVNIIEINTDDTPTEFVVEWGDATTEHFNQDDEQDRRVHHVYEKTGQYNGLVSIRDQSECVYERFFSVEVIEREDSTSIATHAPWAMSFLAVSWAITLRGKIKKIKK